ncbi:MAG: YDG domain-containing protein, partial [Sulfuricurvum sp.]|nr:YDG domain-containing protein [Sulfuricurvum sp.]
SGTAAGTFASKNAGLQNVTVSGLTLAGTDADNYNIVEQTGLSATIIRKSLTAAISSDPSKTYDGTNGAILTSNSYRIDTGISGENFTINQTTGTYNSKDVLSANSVMVSLTSGDFTVNGSTLASNYVLPTTAIGMGTITPKDITVIADSLSKVYATLDPVLTYRETGLASDDTLGGTLRRVLGETSGDYEILEGTLINPNYVIAFTKGVFTVRSDIQNYITTIVNNHSIDVEPPITATIDTAAIGLGIQQTNISAVNTNIPVISLNNNQVFTISNGGVRLPAGLTQDLPLVQNINATNNGDKN